MTPDDLIERAGELGSPPSVLHQLQAVVKKRSSSAEDIGRIIAADGPLSARLLKLANSALFGLKEEIDEIPRAVTLIGTKRLQALAMATSVIDAFQGIDLGAFDADAFWRHSLGVAVAGRAIAEHCRDSNPEHLFLVGVLHDLGRLVMLVGDRERMVQAIGRARKNKIPLGDAEQSCFGFDHCLVGKALIDTWRLPSTVSQPVIRHHQPGGDRNSCIVHIADAFAHGLGFGASGERSIPPLQDTAWDLLSLTPKPIRALIERIDAEFPTVVDLLLGDSAKAAAAPSRN